jgi:hypothetical protein
MKSSAPRNGVRTQVVAVTVNAVSVELGENCRAELTTFFGLALVEVSRRCGGGLVDHVARFDLGDAAGGQGSRIERALGGGVDGVDPPEIDRQTASGISIRPNVMAAAPDWSRLNLPIRRRVGRGLRGEAISRSRTGANFGNDVVICNSPTRDSLG